MIAYQMSLLPEVNEKEVQKVVIDELRNYQSLKVQRENKKEQEQEGVTNLFPILRDQSRVNEIKIKQIDRAIHYSLDYIERKIVERKYLNPLGITDLEIYLELGIKKDKFYDKKRSAILNIATALGII